MNPAEHAYSTLVKCLKKRKGAVHPPAILVFAVGTDKGHIANVTVHNFPGLNRDDTGYVAYILRLLTAKVSIDSIKDLRDGINASCYLPLGVSDKGAIFGYHLICFADRPAKYVPYMIEQADGKINLTIGHALRNVDDEAPALAQMIGRLNPFNFVKYFLSPDENGMMTANVAISDEDEPKDLESAASSDLNTEIINLAGRVKNSVLDLTL